MAARRVVRSMSQALPLLLIGVALWLKPPATPAGNPFATSHSFISSPRESLPLPVHDEATCAFCQAAAFAPHAGHTGGILPVVWGTEHQAVLSYDDRLTHDGAARSPRSRDPPTLQ
jgi:hypothetical protein